MKCELEKGFGFVTIRRVFLALACAGIAAACRDTSVSDPDVSAREAASSVSSVQSDIELVAKGLALALSERPLRQELKERLRRSRFREHKQLLQDSLLAGGGDRLIHRAAARIGVSRAEFIRIVRNLPAIELDMPVRSQRARWNGQTPAMVVAALAETDTPIGFTSDGSRVVLTRDAPPDVPVIVLTAREVRSEDTVAVTPSQSLDGVSASLLPIMPPGECNAMRSPLVEAAAAPLLEGCSEQPPGVYPPAWPQLGALPSRPGV